MSSGFVSGGTTEAPIERSDEWLAAQKEIDAKAVQRAEAARQPPGKSLFETLEANKAAKQEAFEEANRIKNQFRALDEDEVEFLDSVLERTRAEEARVKQETAEGLAQFRQQQEQADKKARRGSDGGAIAVAEEGSPAEEESWVAGGRKRKRAKEKEVLKGVKIRKSSFANEVETPTKGVPPSGDTTAAKQEPAAEQSTALARADESSTSRPNSAVVKKPPALSKPSLGLVSYGSDDDDDY